MSEAEEMGMDNDDDRKWHYQCISGDRQQELANFMKTKLIRDDQRDARQRVEPVYYTL